MIISVFHQLSKFTEKLNSEFYTKNILFIYNSLFTLVSFASIFIPIDTYTGSNTTQKILIVFCLLIIPGIIGFLYSSIYEKTHHINKKKLKNGYFIIEHGDLHCKFQSIGASIPELAVHLF